MTQANFPTEIQRSFKMEIAQFLNGVITACGNHFLTHYLASLGDVARGGAFMSIFRFLCCGALACSLGIMFTLCLEIGCPGQSRSPDLSPFAVGNHCARGLNVLVSESCCIESRQKMNKLTQSLTLI
jgi:hypothetical protein